MRQTDIRNDRNAVIAIVAEHVTADDRYLRRAVIQALVDCPKNIKLLEHNSNWIFGYDSKANIIYVSL